MLLAFYHFGGKTMTKAEAVSLLMQAVGWFGGLSVVSIGVAAFVSKLIADRSIESHKAQLGQETERLKGELAKETESHKFSLKKLEIRFDRQIEAALAYSKVYEKLEPHYSHPDKDWDEVLEESNGEFHGYCSQAVPVSCGTQRILNLTNMNCRSDCSICARARTSIWSGSSLRKSKTNLTSSKSY